MKYLVLDKDRWNNALEEADHILKYTLLLPDSTAITNADPSSWIPDSLEKLFDNCIFKIFPNSGDFFGQSKPKYEFSELPPTSYYKKESLFPKTLLLHCVVYAYSVISSFTSTFQTTYSRANIDFESELNKNDTTLRAAEATRLSNAIKNHLRVMNNQSFPLFWGSKKETQIETSQAALFQSIMDFDARKFGSVLRLYNYDENSSTPCKISNSLTKTSELYKMLIKQAPDDIPERLLWFYRIENIFGLDLLSQILSNINDLKIQGTPYPNGINSYRTLSYANRLPNSLSRSLYIHYAFSAINESFSEQTYFFKELFNFDIIAQKIPPVQKALPIHTWHIFFERFCRFFSDFACPVVEWYFMLTLIKTTKKHLSKCNIEKQMSALKPLLRQYMIEHEKDFFSSDTKELEKRFDTSLDTLPPCDISKLLTEFRKRAYKLNLLTPELTLSTCTANHNTNIKKIRGSYISFLSNFPITSVPGSTF